MNVLSNSLEWTRAVDVGIASIGSREPCFIFFFSLKGSTLKIETSAAKGKECTRKWIKICRNALWQMWAVNIIVCFFLHIHAHTHTRVHNHMHTNIYTYTLNCIHTRGRKLLNFRNTVLKSDGDVVAKAFMGVLQVVKWLRLPTWRHCEIMEVVAATIDVPKMKTQI